MAGSASTLPDAVVARWRSHAHDVDGGHTRWCGPDVFGVAGAMYRPARVAFTLRTGREPVGKVRADCGMTWCVAPAHVEDQAGRRRSRTQLRAVYGLPEPAAVCRHGHDQAVHGHLRPDGTMNCNACKVVPVGSYLRGEERLEVGRRLRARYEAGESITQIAADLGRSYGHVRQVLLAAGTRMRPPGFHHRATAARADAS